MNNKIPGAKFLLPLLFIAFLFAACSPSDKDIAESVKAKISNFAKEVSVDVKDGVVTLSGQVADEATKTAVESALQGIKGVKSVVNDITVPPPPPPPTPVTINPDDVLRQTIESGLSARGIKGITVSIANGEVTLTGDVKKADLTTVMQIANEAKPAKVINQMKVLK